MNGRFSTIIDPYRRADGTLKHDTATMHHPKGTLRWIGVDGEGINADTGHRYVLLGVGQEQI